mmetsp:Transcript_27541/g.50160  ORF Transcript_27541/g.50160 Transcript_27541/m.50160 type:complete len:209 (-) Transcript_27541:1464-2090(-)
MIWNLFSDLPAASLSSSDSDTAFGPVPPGSSSSSSSPSTSLSTVIFLLGRELFFPRSLLTSTADNRLTSSSSTATILSFSRIFPKSTLSSLTSNTYAGPGGAGGSGITSITPSFPFGAMISNCRSSFSWMTSLVVATRRGDSSSYVAACTTAPSSGIMSPRPGPTSRSTVIFLSACRLFPARSLLTVTADMRCTSMSSTAMTLSSNWI